MRDSEEVVLQAALFFIEYGMGFTYEKSISILDKHP